MNTSLWTLCSVHGLQHRRGIHKVGLLVGTVMVQWKTQMTTFSKGGICRIRTLEIELVIFAHQPWWRHQMETFSPLLALCAGNSSVTGEFPAQWPVTRSFDILFFYPSLNKRLSKQRIHRWFETPSRLLWRQSNGRIITQKAPGFDMGSMSFSEIPRNCAEWHLVSKRKTDIYMIQIILHLDRETWVNI